MFCLRKHVLILQQKSTVFKMHCDKDELEEIYVFFDIIFNTFGLFDNFNEVLRS